MKLKNIITIIAAAITSTAAIAQTTTEFPSPAIKIEADPSAGDVMLYIASDDGSNRMTMRTLGFGEGTNVKNNGTITIRPDKKRQDIDGFGFAITGSAAYNLLKMAPADRKALLTEVFSRKDGYGCSYVRVPIGCSDFSLSEYTCCDKEGIANFALTREETSYIIPVMKEILAINPDVKVISAPWTAPRWMKTNGKWTDGNLKKECYQDYAEYFVKWIKAFEKNGIKIYGVTPQNEPLNRGNSASMYMGWDEERDFIKQALGPKFKANGITTKIYVFDHNYNYDNIATQKSYPTKIYNDTEASAYISGAAYHNYGGNASEMTNVYKANPDKELIFTEWTAGTWSWPGVGMEAITADAKALIFDVVKNHGRGAIVWNLMLDSDRGPYRPGGCSTGNGAVDISKKDYKSLTYNSFYYVMCLAASAVSENAVNIGTDGTISGIDCVAFKNNDGFGIVIMNTNTAERKVLVTEGSHKFLVTLPAKSVASCRW